MAKNFSFSFIRGDTRVAKFGITDEEGNTLKLSSSDEIYFTVKKTYKTNTIILQKKYSTGELLYTDGVLIVEIKHDDTKSLSYGTYVYDIEVNLSNGSLVDTPWVGEIELDNEATWG